MKWSIKKSVVVVSLLMVLYLFIMEYYYQYWIIPNYPKFGFHLDFSFDKYLQTKILFAITLIVSILVSRKSEFAYAVLIFFIIFFFVPSLVTYAFSNQIAGPIYSIFALMISLGTVSSLRIRIPIANRIEVTRGLLFFFMALLLIPIVLQFGFYLDVSNLLLQNVYNTRDFFDTNANTPTNYLFNWLIKAVVPVAIVYFLINRHYWFALASFFVLIYLYVISGNKMIYVSSFVMLFFFFFGKGYLGKVKMVSVCLILGLVATLLIDYYFNMELKAVFVMRMLFLHAYLNYFYFDLFSNSPLYYADSTFFNLFSTYPYDKPIGFVIAEMYIHVHDMNANNGLIGDGYMNLGYLGVAIHIVVVSVIFLFFNSLDIDPRYLGLFFFMTFLFLNVPFLTEIITGGVWLIGLMGLTIMRREEGIGKPNLA